MLAEKRLWFQAFPWDEITKANRQLCEKGENTPFGENAHYADARDLWSKCSAQPMPLREALDTCSRIHKLAPFNFFNGNTMAIVTRALIDEVVKPLPSVQAQIVRTTVAHYVMGMIRARELQEVFDSFKPFWTPQNTRS